VDSKKIVILKGSPRKNGNSNVLADQAEAGAKEAGAEVISFFLQGMHIEGCSGCDACQVKGDQVCTIQDDMQKIYPIIKEADGILFTSAIYWFTYTAQLKLAIDRLYAFERPAGSILMGKPVGIILTYGDSDPMKSGCINAIHSFQDMFSYLRAPIRGIVHGSAMDVGDVKSNKALMQKAFNLGQKLAKGSA
jgi:multimeric flavodoxin WrbA